MSMSAFVTQQALMSVSNAIKTLSGYEFSEQQYAQLAACADALRSAVASSMEKAEAKAKAAAEAKLAAEEKAKAAAEAKPE